MQISCAVGMRNAKLRNHLQEFLFYAELGSSQNLEGLTFAAWFGEAIEGGSQIPFYKCDQLGIATLVSHQALFPDFYRK